MTAKPEKTRILIVEDEAITALDIKRMLENLGYGVLDVVTTGHEAVSRIEDLKPDLILMDIVLNDELDGIDAARMIQEKMDIPVVYLTANADSNTITRADETDHYGYLIKPVNIKDLQSIMTTAVQRHKLKLQKSSSQ